MYGEVYSKMTVLRTKNKVNQISYMKKSGIAAIVIIIVSLFITLYLSTYILEYVKVGMRLCYSAVIGSVFPFIIITDILYSYADFGTITGLRYCFEKLFKINGYASGAFIIGILCGFPLGVRAAVRLYRDGLISRDECERLIGFSNNTGPAFVVSGIGAAMRGSFFDGIVLYVSMILSAICVGIITGRGKKATKNISDAKRSSFDLSESIRGAGLGTLNISAFVIFFSVICGILDLLIKSNFILAIILPFIEISNSAKMLSLIHIPNDAIDLLFTSFAVSFSGLSVHLQAKSFIHGTDIKMKTYYSSKLIQGFISVAITALILIIT